MERCGSPYLTCAQLERVELLIVLLYIDTL
jgi:hypothetical protein